MTYTTCTCICPQTQDLLLGQSDVHILRVPQGEAQPTQRHRFSGAPVQWLLATPDGRTVAAGHACGLMLVFDALTGHAQNRNTCQLQSEYKTTPARTTGLLSNDGRWLLACDLREEKDVGFLLDLQQQQAPRRLVLPKVSPAFTPPALQHSFVMLTSHHPALLECRIDSPEPLRQVQAKLVCSEHLELTGHYFDRQAGEQLFQKDILPGHFNSINWRIHMPKPQPPGRWLCTAIVTASNDAGLVGRHLLPFYMPEASGMHGGA